MIQKKICMVGTFAVGKTSLVKRYVESLFSEKYLTTVGVKIDKKQVTLGDTEIMMMLWDLAGEDEFCKIRHSYLRGAAGYILVFDGTRRSTLERGMALYEKVINTVGDVPFVVAINKHDLSAQWEMDDETINEFTRHGWDVCLTSAKTGEHVEEMFRKLAEKMVN